MVGCCGVGFIVLIEKIVGVVVEEGCDFVVVVELVRKVNG